jgi:hypothetical protein
MAVGQFNPFIHPNRLTNPPEILETTVVNKSIVAVILMLLLTGCASTPDGMNVQFGIDYNPSK